MIFAVKGEQIFNEDGSLHATVVRDILSSEPLKPSSFEFVGKPPVIGSPVTTPIMRWVVSKYGDVKR